MKSLPILLAALALAPLPAFAQAPAAPIASQETNWAGITADVTEFRRKGNTLNVKLKLRNTGAEDAKFDVTYKDVYLLDAEAGKKYEVLKDDAGTYLASNNAGYKDEFYGTLKPAGSVTVWMKFPAPPPETKAASLTLPHMAPFEDVPIQDM